MECENIDDLLKIYDWIKYHCIDDFLIGKFVLLTHTRFNLKCNVLYYIQPSQIIKNLTYNKNNIIKRAYACTKIFLNRNSIDKCTTENARLNTDFLNTYDEMSIYYLNCIDSLMLKLELEI
jgi:hypothetical protein